MVFQKLRHAIENLLVFVKHNDAERIPSLYQLDVKDDQLVSQKAPSSLAKMINLIKLVFCRVPAEMVHKRDNIQQTLLKAVSTVSSHFPLIEKMKHGSPDEQQFAEKALEVINRYNTVLAKDDSKTLPWIRYIYEHNQLTLDDELKKSVIVFPQTISFRSESSLSSKKVRQGGISLSQKFSSCITPSQPEVDAFRMKAIRLFQDEQIPTSIHEALKAESPIAHTEEQSQHAIVSLQQVLKPFPGEEIKLIGSFKRIQNSLSIPIPESFRMSSQSTQTGYPDPLQLTGGLSFSDVLFPYPLRLDQLPQFQKMANKKREVAIALLPKGGLRDKAKRLLEAKKSTFEKDPSTFIQLHNKLGHSILAAGEARTEANSTIVDNFYTHVESQQNPYNYLADIHRTIEKKCLASLYQVLHEEWLEVGNPILRGDDGEKKVQYASELMQKRLTSALDEINVEAPSPEAAAYMTLMGRLLGLAAQQIILKSMLEKMGGFRPPMLNDFQRKVLACSISQIDEFLRCLTENEVEDVDSQMKWIIQTEIDLFDAPDFDQLTTVPADIVDELEAYYFDKELKAKS